MPYRPKRKELFRSNECKISDQESDDDIASINSKDNGDDADDDDDDDDADADADADDLSS